MTPIDSTKLNIITWNVRGLRDPRKRRQILSYLDRHQVHVAMLQETHFNPRRNITFACKWAAHRIFSSFSSYARGVAILVKRGTPFTLTGATWDAQGRYCLTWGRLGSDSVTLACCYGPNVDDPQFITEL